MAIMQIFGGQITDSAITSGKIADGHVITDKIADLNVTEAKLATDAVTTNKITDLNVTLGKLETNVQNVLPTSDEKAALTGPSGYTPSASDPYATQDYVDSIVDTTSGAITLQTVTDNGNSTTNGITVDGSSTFNSDLHVEGDLYVTGTEYITNTEIISGDQIIAGKIEINGDSYLGNENTDTVFVSGGMYIGGQVDMQSHKVVNLANGTVSGDAVNYGQMTGGDSSTLSSAQSYTDTASGNLATYIDVRDAYVLGEAESYADGVAATAESNANSYTDTASGNLASYIDVRDAWVLSQAESYADGVAATAESNANAYTDTASANLVAYVDQQVGANNDLEEILANGNSAGSYDIDMNGNKVVNVGTPTASGDAATKDYVDNAISGAGGTPTQDGFSGTGSQTDFSLSQTPVSNSENVYVNGIRQRQTTHYSITGTTLSFTDAPDSGALVDVMYSYLA